MIFGRQSQHKHEPFLLTDLLGKEILHSQASLPGSISIRAKIPDQLPLIKGNPSHLRQLIAHLLTNARDAMPDGGDLIVTLSHEKLEGVINFQGLPLSGSYLCLRVEDTGQGMEEATLERIFEPFFTTKEEGKGVGLGLSIVLGIVEQHEGDIQVKSQLGAGTTVSVYLPVLTERKEEEVSILSEMHTE